MGKTEYKIVYCGRKSRHSPDSLTIVPLSDCQTPWCYTWLPLDHENHISNLARSANSELPRITSIRHLLFTDATWTPCLCLCSVTPCLLQLSPVWLCPVSLKQTPKSSREKKKEEEKKSAARFILRFQKLIRFVFHWILSTGCPLIHDYCTNSLLCATTVSTRLLLTKLKIYITTRQLHPSSDTSISISLFSTVRTHSIEQRSFSFSVAPSVLNALPCKYS